MASWCGGESCLTSYGTGGRVGTLDDIPERHWEFVQSVCVNWYETATHVVFFELHQGVGEAPLTSEGNPDLQELLEPLVKAARLRIESYVAVVLSYDAIDAIQTQARALADTLGGEEMLEYAVLDLRRNARAVVLNFDED